MNDTREQRKSGNNGAQEERKSGNNGAKSKSPSSTSTSDKHRLGNGARSTSGNVGARNTRLGEDSVDRISIAHAPGVQSIGESRLVRPQTLKVAKASPEPDTLSNFSTCSTDLDENEIRRQLLADKWRQLFDKVRCLRCIF